MQDDKKNPARLRETELPGRDGFTGNALGSCLPGPAREPRVGLRLLPTWPGPGTLRQGWASKRTGGSLDLASIRFRVTPMPSSGHFNG